MDDSDHALDRPSLATHLYECCFQLAVDILKSPRPTLTSSSLQHFRTQVEKLSLWGSDFDVSQGFLHEHLLGADRLSNALLSVLEDLAGTLIALAKHLLLEEKLSENIARTHKLRGFASEAISRPTPDRHDDSLVNLTVDELSSSSSEGTSNDEADQLEDLIKDFQFHNDCLFGLGQVLREPAENVRYLNKKSSVSAEAQGAESVSRFAWSHGLVKPEERSPTKKSRSKWASEESVGQEELYEAAEKVLDRLKTMQEYSDLIAIRKKESVFDETPQLEIIRMKLNGLAYWSKQVFVEDLDRVWQNYLKQKVDPEHPLRVKALYMREEAEKLIKLIPNITIRDRADVDAEERRLQNERDSKDGSEDSDDEPIMPRRKLKEPADRGDGIKGSFPYE